MMDTMADFEIAVEGETSEQGSGAVLMVRVADVAIGANPRKYFDPQEFEELKASIALNGLLQPVLVRPSDKEGFKFELVAGGRRFKAVKELSGEDGLIPALVRTLTDAEVEYMASSENLVRADMSVSEESDSAARVLASFNGNKDEAAARLGWTRSKLEKRIALQLLTEEVKDALSRREITVGHAELLCAVPSASQQKALENIKSRSISVADTKAMLMQLSQKLKAAIFDQKDCQGCSYNSSRQQSLLDTNVGEGFCTNSQCFSAKTNEALDAKVVELKDEYRAVHLVRKADGVKWVSLVESQVGSAQFSACQACAAHGALVSGDPGSEGKVTKGACFDTDCNAKKQAAYQEALKGAVKQTGGVEGDSRAVSDQEDEQPNDQSNADDQCVGAEQPESSAARLDSSECAEQEAACPEITGPVAKVHLSAPMKEHRNLVWRRSAARYLSASPEKAHAVMVAMILDGEARHLDSGVLKAGAQKIFSTEAAATEASSAGCKYSVTPFLSSPKEDIVLAQTMAVAGAMKAVSANFFQRLVADLEIQLENYWQIDAALLTLLTKSEIGSVMKEVGFESYISAKAFNKMLSLKKDELIKQITESEFSFQGRIPSFMRLDG